LIDLRIVPLRAVFRSKSFGGSSLVVHLEVLRSAGGLSVRSWCRLFSLDFPSISLEWQGRLLLRSDRWNCCVFFFQRLLVLSLPGQIRSAVKQIQTEEIAPRTIALDGRGRLGSSEARPRPVGTRPRAWRSRARRPRLDRGSCLVGRPISIAASQVTSSDRSSKRKIKEIDPRSPVVPCIA
jgi:hypothetical protein